MLNEKKRVQRRPPAGTCYRHQVHITIENIDWPRVSLQQQPVQGLCSLSLAAARNTSRRRLLNGLAMSILNITISIKVTMFGMSKVLSGKCN